MKRNAPPGSTIRQRGAALLVILIITVTGTAAIILHALNGPAQQIARDKITAAALAQARDALIGRAIKDSNRPGSLPCPDMNDDGSAEIFIGNHCPNYVGRLPWKTLGLTDLHDGNAERLWYALSPSLRDNLSAQPINSDTLGQFAINGNITLNNVAAIVFSPGMPLAALNQTRDSANHNNVASYLEGNNNAYLGTGTYTFSANVMSNTFNDRALGITAEQVFSPVEQRIAKEAANCLQDYASANLHRYPWSAALDPGQPPQYGDKSAVFYGRFPGPPPLPSPSPLPSPAPLAHTRTDSGNAMSDQWPSTDACNNVASWWINWNELLFYSVAAPYQPANTAAPASCSTCIVVNPPSASADKKMVVIVAGKALPGQVRATNAAKAATSNYLEGKNTSGDVTASFEQGPHSATFNDRLIFH